MTLLKRHFAVVTVAVGLLNSPKKPRRFPPTVVVCDQFLFCFPWCHRQDVHRSFFCIEVLQIFVWSLWCWCLQFGCQHLVRVVRARWRRRCPMCLYCCPLLGGGILGIDRWWGEWRNWLLRLICSLLHQHTWLRWCLAEGCSCEFVTVAVVPPLEMAWQVGGGCVPPLEMLQIRVECDVALQFCVAEANLTLKVDFRGPILEVYCRGHPRWCWRDVGALCVLELWLLGLLLGVLVVLETFLDVRRS